MSTLTIHKETYLIPIIDGSIMSTFINIRSVLSPVCVQYVNPPRGFPVTVNFRLGVDGGGGGGSYHGLYAVLDMSTPPSLPRHSLCRHGIWELGSEPHFILHGLFSLFSWIKALFKSEQYKQNSLNKIIHQKLLLKVFFFCLNNSASEQKLTLARIFNNWTMWGFWSSEY